MTTAETDIALGREGDIDFAKPLARALLRDGRLSFAARGLFAFLWDLPAGWRVRPSHLAKMSGAGKDALKRLRRELEQVDALEIREIRLTAGEAVTRNEADPDRLRPYRAGQVVGSRWVLFAPHLWAVELPLGGAVKPLKTLDQSGTHRDAENPTLGVTDSRQDRESGNPPLRFTKAKGFANKKGSATTPASSDPPPLWLEAVEVEIENQRQLKGVTSEDGLRASILKRYMVDKKGPGPGVLKQLEARKRAAERQARASMTEPQKSSPSVARRGLEAAKRALTGAVAP